MVFSSPIFLFLFLPLVLTGYFIMPRAFRNAWLLAASLFFYAWGETFFVLVMLVSIAANYAMGLWIDSARGTARARLPLVIAIVVNLQILVIYKYSGFLSDNLSVLLGLVGLDPIYLEASHLPIGISFFTFQAMSYVIDVYRGAAPLERNPFNVALYIALFPQLIAGPIVRYQTIAGQIRERVAGLEDIAYGIRRFVIGLAKKVLIANTLAVPADAIFGLPSNELTTPLAWLGIACYTLQIYFDFSGYSDMAIGLGRMFGFRFLENFQWPYTARSIQDFWRRWHISLSTWFRDYLYIPLGGNRANPTRTYVNLIAVFFLCGLWHGAAWTFVIWGLFHGGFLVLERTPAGAILAKLPRPIQHLYVLGVVMIAWILFRSENIGFSMHYFAALFGFAEGSSLLRPLPMYFTRDVMLALVVGVIGAMPVFPVLAVRVHARLEALSDFYRELGGLAGTGAYLLLLYGCAMQLSAQTYNPFIYFRF